VNKGFKFGLDLNGNVVMNENCIYDESIGSLCCSIRDGIAYIYNFGIQYNYCGKGNGKKLLSSAVKHILKLGVNEIKIDACGYMEGQKCFDNITIAKFYKRVFVENNSKNIKIKVFKSRKRIYDYYTVNGEF